MLVNKNLVEQRFSRASDSYHNDANVQAVMARELIDRVESQPYDEILEIGCGTGLLSKMIADNLDFKHLILNDISKSMLLHCKNAVPESERVSYLIKDAESLDFKEQDRFDLIISNACLQWMSDLEKVLKDFKSYLKDNGCLAFSIFSEGNFAEIKHCTGLSLAYKYQKTLQKMLSGIFPCYTLMPREIVLYYKDVKSMLRSFKRTGVSGLSGRIWTKTQLNEFIEKYEQNYKSDKGVRLTWKWHYVIAYK